MDTISVDKKDNAAPVHAISNNQDFSYIKITGIFIGFIVLGLVTGYVVGNWGNKTTVGAGGSSNNNSIKKVVGSKDKKTFKDSANGILQEGGFEGEGSYHLERPGGESQNVYLTSSVVDLSQYVDQKVTVWGETFSAEKAGWLMDVGLVEILK